ncbi:MAG TPA: type II toxin-antitoxin system HicB family antitoxin [Caulobacteraceae bacterium]
MTQRFYPAVMERGDTDDAEAKERPEVVALWFPDFPGCVAAAADQQQAVAKAQEALAAAVQALAEHDRPLPAPTPFEDVEVPEDAAFIALIAVAVTLPNPSERVNIYLPKALIERMDRRAEALGMSRSSLAGFAISRALDGEQLFWVKGPAAPAPAKPKARRVK